MMIRLQKWYISLLCVLFHVIKATRLSFLASNWIIQKGQKRKFIRGLITANELVEYTVKIPGQMRTYCRTCRKHTLHEVKIERGGRRGRGLSAGTRRAKRHRSGHGNRGRYSKRPLSQWKMIVKTSKKTDLRIACQDCKKQQVRVYPRTRRVELIR